MKVVLTANEARVIGVLLEKEITTPDVYPMTLNAITNACNQKSNREPVMSLTESEVQSSLDCLKAKHLLTPVSGQRVVKYKHRLCNTEFADWQLSEQEVALIGLLLLRGPQTPGELRSRSQRLAEFEHVGEVEAVLNGLAQHSYGNLVERLPRQVGKRECRYRHLLTDSVEGITEEENNQLSDPVSQESLSNIDLQQLFDQVQSLQERVARLEQRSV